MARCVAGSVCAVLGLAVGGCATYFETVQAEFDSVAGLDEQDQEPDLADYSSEPRRHPWTVRTFEGSGVDRALIWIFGLTPEPTEIENPSGFARERLRLMAELGVGDPFHSAEAAIRLQWAFFADENLLNRIEALRGMVQLLESYGTDPLDWPEAARDPSMLSEPVKTLERRWRAPDQPFDRAEYVAAIERLTQAPLPIAWTEQRGSLQRRLIRSMLGYARRETDQELIEPVIIGLNRSVVHVLVTTLRHAYGESEQVREVAVRSVYALSGPDSVRYSLQRLRPLTDRSQLDLVDLTLIRQCGQLRGPVIYQAEPGGPSPIEFLHSRAMEPGSQLIALEAMAHALDRPVDWDVEWANEWWSRYTIEGPPKDR